MNISWDFPYRSRRSPVFARNVVTTSQPLAAQAGLQILSSGGNAVDAALAAAITLTVVEPCANGIGGDAFAIVWDGERVHGLNASGRAPQNWSLSRFSGREEMPDAGWDAVTVPGAVSAWVALSERFGHLPFERLFEPAVRYATEGFLVSPLVAEYWATAVDIFAGRADFQQAFAPAGRAPAAGERFRFPAQAETLREIAETGGESFYRGRLAEEIVAYAAKTGGALTFDDLSRHQADWVACVSHDYRGVRVHEIPPNGQGLAALIALGIVDHHPLSEFPVDSADSLHIQMEAMKIAFAEAQRHFADPDSMEVEPQRFLDPVYLKARAADIRLDQVVFPNSQIGSGQGTVYLATADEAGNMVSFLQSKYQGFGSGVVVPGTGISLHNRGAGFNLKPGHPNCVAGGKRPFHTIIPAFVTNGGEPIMSFGVMGAHMQAQGHVQMMTRIFDYGQNPQTASDGPRWFVAKDCRIAVEPGVSTAVRAELARRGHRFVNATDVTPHLFGGAQLVLCLADGYCAASDHRKDGQAVGY